MLDSPNAFDRVTPQVQFALFPALQQAYKENASCLGSDHLLAGLMWVDSPLMERTFLPTPLENLRKRFGGEAAASEFASQTPSARDVPFGPQLTEIFAASQVRADALGDSRIGTRHILAELLTRQESRAAIIAKECGVDLAKSSAVLESSEFAPGVAKLRSAVARIMRTREAQGDITILQEYPITVLGGPIGTPFISIIRAFSPSKGVLLSRFPLLCVEVVTAEEKMISLTGRVRKYLESGVPSVWVLSSETKHAYEATTETGLREVKDSALRTENPVLELPLAEIFE